MEEVFWDPDFWDADFWDPDFWSGMDQAGASADDDDWDDVGRRGRRRPRTIKEE